MLLLLNKLEKSSTGTEIDGLLKSSFRGSFSTGVMPNN